MTGHVKNLSSFQTLCLEPLEPEWIDNAGGQGAHDISVPFGQAAPALAGPIKPGQAIPFQLQVLTENGGSGTSAVELVPTATKGDPGDDCNVLKTLAKEPLPAPDVKLHPDSTKFRAAVAPGLDRATAGEPVRVLRGLRRGLRSRLHPSAQVRPVDLQAVHHAGRCPRALKSGGAAGLDVLSQLWHTAAVSSVSGYLATPAERWNSSGRSPRHSSQRAVGANAGRDPEGHRSVDERA